MSPVLPGHFPVDAILPALGEALAASPVVLLEAPPGAGKTTRVPLAVRDTMREDASRIVMLEPRRVAARAAAGYMARTLGESVGQTVGYRVRGDTRVGPRTRIEVVTEGILTRQLVHDPSLEGIGVLLFDEFHERSLHADTGLALALETQQALRPDLRLVLMSATLDGGRLQAMLADAIGQPVPILRAEGRQFPVQLVYRPPRGDAPVETRVVAAVREAVATYEGDVLAFLPGAGEIDRAARALQDALPADVQLYPLHGTRSAAEQDAAIAPSRPGQRKVVLATSIAETSLTIEGVRVVIDSGLARVPRFSARTGMTRLETVRVTQASATQRAGRAGRVAPGVCVRLWDEAETAGLVPHTRAEILEADLAPLLLDLAAAGVRDPATLHWLDAPPPAAVAQARELLRLLDALDADGRLTEIGRAMRRVGAHPRLGRLLVAAQAAGASALGAVLVALLEERDILRGERRFDGPPLRPPVDLAERAAIILDTQPTAALPAGVSVDRGLVHRVREQARLHRRVVAEVGPDGASSSGSGAATVAASGTASHSASALPTLDLVGALVAAAYPDRVAQRREGAADAREVRWVMRSGQGAVLEAADPLARAEWLAIADLDGQPPNARIYRAAALDDSEVGRLFATVLTTHEVVTVDDTRVRAVRETRLGAIVVRTAPLRDVSDEALAAALARAAIRRGVGTLPWTSSSTQLRERLAFLRSRDASWPDVSDAALEATVEQWLAPQLLGKRALADVQRVSLEAALRDLLDWQQRAALDTLAPTHLEVPTGSRIALDYRDPDAPVLAVRLQELFGLAETPRIHRGEVGVVLHLLSPAHRPVQVTRDLAGFWATSYFDVRKELRGRYPKHVWPDDPRTAAPTRRAKPRGT